MQTYIYIYIYIIIYIYNICICLCVHLVKQYTPMYKCKLNTYNINTIVDILYGTSFKRLRPPQYSASAPCHFLRAFRLSQLRQRSEALKKAVGMFFSQEQPLVIQTQLLNMEFIVELAIQKGYFPKLCQFTRRYKRMVSTPTPETEKNDNQIDIHRNHIRGMKRVLQERIW